jgi:hypothetical protein
MSRLSAVSALLTRADPVRCIFPTALGASHGDFGDEKVSFGVNRKTHPTYGFQEGSTCIEKTLAIDIENGVSEEYNVNLIRWKVGDSWRCLHERILSALRRYSVLPSFVAKERVVLGGVYLLLHPFTGSTMFSRRRPVVNLPGFDVVRSSDDIAIVADYVIPTSSLDNMTLWASVFHSHPFSLAGMCVMKNYLSIEYPAYKVSRIKKCRKREKYFG